MDRQREGIALGLLVMAGWSFPGVFVRLMPDLVWHEATAVRLAIAMAATLPAALLHRRELRRAFDHPRVPGLALAMVAYYATATAAFYNAPLGEVAVLIASAPAWAALWHYLHGHRDRLNELYGAMVAIAGVAVVSIPSFGSRSPAPGYHPLGVFLAIASAVCAAVYAIGVGRLFADRRHPGSLPLAWLTFFLGTILLGFWTPAHTVRLLAEYWPQALALGVLSTAMPTVAFAAASERLPRGLTTIFNPAVAVTANLAAILAIGEYPSWWAVPGGLLVLAGVVMTLRTKN
ncbi:MAG TPA: DMT family transporter [Fimbriimonas sp.]